MTVIGIGRPSEGLATFDRRDPLTGGVASTAPAMTVAEATAAVDPAAQPQAADAFRKDGDTLTLRWWAGRFRRPAGPSPG
jgi:benzaldehyde dehydrogenase (NAD)